MGGLAQGFARQTPEAFGQGETQYNPYNSVVLKSRNPQYPDIQIPSGANIVVGRSSSASVQIDSPFVSARHLTAKINENGQVMIRDLSSTNGTYLNATQLKPNRSYPMEPGSKLKIGSDEVVYTL